MPTIDYSGTVDFEVYCSECGTGICDRSDMDHRKMKLYVYCPVCKKAYEDVIGDLEQQIKDLNSEMVDLNNIIDQKP